MAVRQETKDLLIKCKRKKPGESPPEFGSSVTTNRPHQPSYKRGTSLWIGIAEKVSIMCNENMPVSVKVYYGHPTSSTVEIRRFVFRPEQKKARTGTSVGIYQALLERIRSVFNGLNLHNLHLCWKDDDGDYVVFSSDDELRVAISSTSDNTLRIFIREKQLPVRLSRNGDISDADLAGYARIVKRGTDQHRSHRHYRRSARSASASRDSDVSSPNISYRRAALLKETGDQVELFDHHPSSTHDPQGNSNGTPDSNNRGDSGTSTSSGVVEESSDTVKCSSNDESGPCPVALCSECRGVGRRGILYQCTVCQGFLLCSECENRGLHDHHIMVRVRTIGDNQSV